MATVDTEPNITLTTPLPPVIDPTVNVKDALQAAIARFDALRMADREAHESLRMADIRTYDAEMRRIKELMEMRAIYTEKLEVAEAKRIDAIRAVDVNAVAIANQRATDQAAVLANQVAASAETLRILVSQTAAAAKQQLDQTTSQLSDRIAAVERFQYEGKNLSGVIPPAVVEQLAQLQESRYKSEGRGTLSAPLLMMIAALSGGLIIFIVEQFMSR